MEGIWATPRQKLRKRRRPKLFFETHLVLVSNHLHPDRHRVFVACDRRRLQVDALVEDHGGEVREHADKHPVHEGTDLLYLQQNKILLSLLQVFKVKGIMCFCCSDAERTTGDDGLNFNNDLFFLKNRSYYAGVVFCVSDT